MVACLVMQHHYTKQVSHLFVNKQKQSTYWWMQWCGWGGNNQPVWWHPNATATTACHSNGCDSQAALWWPTGAMRGKPKITSNQCINGLDAKATTSGFWCDAVSCFLFFPCNMEMGCSFLIFCSSTTMMLQPLQIFLWWCVTAGWLHFIFFLATWLGCRLIVLYFIFIPQCMQGWFDIAGLFYFCLWTLCIFPREIIIINLCINGINATFCCKSFLGQWLITFFTPQCGGSRVNVF